MTQKTKVFFRRTGLSIMAVSVALYVAVGAGLLKVDQKLVGAEVAGFKLHLDYPTWLLLFGLVVFLGPMIFSVLKARGWVK